MVNCTLVQGHILEVLPEIRSESVNLMVTSPPYWGLRYYGKKANHIWGGDPDCKHKWVKRPMKLLHENTQGKGSRLVSSRGKTKRVHGYKFKEGAFCQKCGAWYGQLGLEPTLDLYVEHLLQVTLELRRILRNDGVMFWNHSDAYGGSLQGWGAKQPSATGFQKPAGIDPRYSKSGPPPLAKMTPQCMVLQNFRLVIKMIEQGWILRNIIIWHKPNAMPSSVKTRFANRHEPIFMFVKNVKPLYWYNVKTGQIVNKQPLGIKGKKGIDWEWRKVIKSDQDGLVDDEDLKTVHRKASLWRSANYYFDLDAVREPLKTASFERLKYPTSPYGDQNTGSGARMTGSRKGKGKSKVVPFNASGKNPGDVWKIATQPFSGAHFATFPERLVEPMIKSSCPQEICKKCGLPRMRITKTEYIKIGRKFKKSKYQGDKVGLISGCTKPQEMRYGRAIALRRTVGWSKCGCNAGFRPGIVLDPFSGSGTTLVKAAKLGRDSVGADINPDYIKMSVDRILKESGDSVKVVVRES